MLITNQTNKYAQKNGKLKVNFMVNSAQNIHRIKILFPLAYDMQLRCK